MADRYVLNCVLDNYNKINATQSVFHRYTHRRRNYKYCAESKTKVVASVWGANFIQFLAVLAILPRSIWKNRVNSSFSFKSTEAKFLARQGNELNLPPPPNRCDELCLAFCINPSSMDTSLAIEFILHLYCTVEHLVGVQEAAS